MTIHFDLLGAVYDRIFPPPPVEEWRKLLYSAGGGAILDVGGGTGRVATVLSELAGRVVVCDLSRGMLRRARDRSCVWPVRGAAEQLPFRSGMFAAVVAVDSLHHFQDQQRALEEMVRVLRPDGRLVIDEPDVRFRAVKLVWLLERLAGMRSRFLAPNEIARRLQQLGLRTEIHEGGPTSAKVVAWREQD